jgi:EAL domain-containing protein (putative c-di-GMP-specific phosphodiesterase class I)
MSGLVDPVHRVDQMLLVLQACGREPRDVVLEITERELVGDLSRLKLVVSAYRREGFRFAVDDVGEGHSTLEVLAATSPDFVKIARSLVIDAATAGPRAAIRAVVAFAGELGAHTIAEGIETEGTASFMRQLGVHLGQGWLFGRPELPPSPAPQTLLSQTIPGGR